MHSWGKWPDEMFRKVDDAAYEIGQFLRRWGRVPVTSTKEKYGTARVYVHFGWTSVHDLTHPGYAFIQYKGLPAKLYWATLTVQQAFFRTLNRVVIPYHTWLYRLSYKRAIAKYPEIREEILEGSDWDEYLEGL